MRPICLLITLAACAPPRSGLEPAPSPSPWTRDIVCPYVGTEVNRDWVEGRGGPRNELLGPNPWRVDMDAGKRVVHGGWFVWLPTSWELEDLTLGRGGLISYMDGRTGQLGAWYVPWYADELRHQQRAFEEEQYGPVPRDWEPSSGIGELLWSHAHSAFLFRTRTPGDDRLILLRPGRPAEVLRDGEPDAWKRLLGTARVDDSLRCAYVDLEGRVQVRDSSGAEVSTANHATTLTGSTSTSGDLRSSVLLEAVLDGAGHGIQAAYRVGPNRAYEIHLCWFDLATAERIGPVQVFRGTWEGELSLEEELRGGFVPPARITPSRDGAHVGMWGEGPEDGGPGVLRGAWFERSESTLRTGPVPAVVPDRGWDDVGVGDGSVRRVEIDPTWLAENS